MRTLLFLADEKPAAPADGWLIDVAAWGRRRAADFLARPRHAPTFVRLGPIGADGLAADLDALVPARPDGVLLAGAVSGHDVERLSAMLRPPEAAAGLADRSIPVLAALETAATILRMDTFRDTGAQLAGLVLDVAALPTGARAHARAATLLAAATAGVPAWLVDDDRDPAEARRAGFAGIAAHDPARLEVIRRA